MRAPAMPRTDFQRLTRRYTGDTAQHYDARRSGSAKWQAEQAIVERLLSRLAAGASLVDIPVGTGRFLRLYRQLGLAATGMDVSDDMLARAREKHTDLPLRRGDIRAIDAADGAYDCALCIRFLNWIDTEPFEAVIRELARVSRRHVIVGVRSFAPSSRLTLRRRLRQRWTRRQPHVEGQIVVHDHDAVHAAFHAARLIVESASCVERSPDGTDYEIYHLTKR